MQPVDSNFRRRLRHEILSYWMDHPEAKDTAEGIHLWWLGNRSDLTTPVIQAELKKLVCRGWAIERGTSEAHWVYALNRLETESISAYLRSEGRADADREDAD